MEHLNPSRNWARYQGRVKTQRAPIKTHWGGTASEFGPFAFRAPGFGPHVRIWTLLVRIWTNISYFGPNSLSQDQIWSKSGCRHEVGHPRPASLFSEASPQASSQRHPASSTRHSNLCSETSKLLIRGIPSQSRRKTQTNGQYLTTSCFQRCFSTGALLLSDPAGNPLVRQN